jgi:TolB-like protein/tRNA A-37 threonylcarbamoyl transferase component Bud32
MHDVGRLTAALAGRYAVQKEVGRGGMAAVYLAEDQKHRRRVAIKVLNPDLAAVLGAERFLREIELAAGLTHPHILPVYDSGNADGFLFYVMPYVEGESLRDRLKREKQLPVDDALRICREIADGLSYAHAHGIVHRDIKPENILLQSGHAVIADFGIAHAIDRAGGEQLTATGVSLGTPAYMSPEQALGGLNVDGRSDLYSLGCVLYELLAGQPPFTGPTIQSLVHQHASVPAPDILNIRPGVPAHVAATLQRALSKTPADRFNPVALFAEALGHTFPPPAPVSVPRERTRVALLTGLVVLALAAVTLAVWSMRAGRTPPLPSAQHARTAIAVLPFQNLSVGEANAYFAGGLHDELLTQLAKVASLTVMGRTSVMPYAGTTKQPREIARELSVGSIVEGTVQVIGDRLRVNVNLIDPDTGRQVWADQYNRTLDDAFAIQSDIATRIVAAVGSALGGTERDALSAAPTANAEAYRLYLQGQEYRRRPGAARESYESMLQLDERAIALDPGFVLAHVALAYAHGAMFWNKFDTSPARAARQFAEAETALRLAPALPEAHWAIGLARYWGRRDYHGALDELAIALGGLPNDADLITMIGAVHRRLGHWAEADAAFEKAARLDPRNAGLFSDGGNTYLLTRRYADAIRTYERAIVLAPDIRGARLYKAMTYAIWRGELDPLRTTLASLPLDAQLGAYGPASGYRAQLLLWERQPDALLALLSRTEPSAFDGYFWFLPTSLYAGWAHQMQGNTSAARQAFSLALGVLDSGVPGVADERVHAARGLALAGLNRKPEALAEARWLEQSPVYREDKLLGTHVAEDRALILAQAGEPSAALDEIERLLAEPSLLSVPILRLDPRWDPIRAQPRFTALLVKYANPEAR